MFNSIRSKILFPSAILVFLGLSIQTFVFYVRSKDEMNKNINQEIESQVHNKSIQISEWIERNRKDIARWSKNGIFTAAFSDTFIGKSAVRASTSDMSAIVLSYDFYEGLFLANSKGDIIASSDPSEIGRMNVKSSDFFIDSMKNNVFVSDMTSGPLSKNPYFVISAPVDNVESKVEGVFFGVIKGDVFSNIFFHEFRIGKTGYAFIINKSGMIVAHTDESHIMKRDSRNSAFVQDILSRKNGRFQSHHDDKEIITAIENISGSNWILALVAPVEEVFEPIKRMRNILIAIGLCVVFFLTLTVWYLAEKLIIVPVRTLAADASIIGQQDYSHEIVITRSDELGVLAYNLSLMRDSIRNKINELELEINERKKAEHELARHRDNLEELVKERTSMLSEANESLIRITTAIEHCSDGIIVMDHNKGYHYANPAFSEMFGYSYDEFKNAEITPTKFFVDKNLAKEIFAAVNSRSSWNGEADLLNKSGKVIPVMIRVNAVNVMSGKLTSSVTIFTDITRRKKAEAELAAAQKELLEHAHQAGMTDIITGILHNVGNVLNSIKTSVFMLHEGIERSSLKDLHKANQLLSENMNCLEDFVTRNPKGRKLMQYYLKLEELFNEDKEKSILHLDRLTEKVKIIEDIIIAQQNYAVSASLNEEMAIIDFIEYALAIQSESIARYSITIVKDYHDVPKVVIQKTKFTHILINLIQNARDAMKDIPPQERILKFVVYSNDAVYLKIIDNGAGIHPDNIEKIFSHGFTTKEGGHGFGLHSSANYMHEMGGRMWAESKGEGKGSTFVLRFPISPPTSTYSI